MGFGKIGSSDNFSTPSRRYSSGFVMVVDLAVDLPSKYDGAVLGPPTDKGFLVTCFVVSVLGATSPNAPVNGDSVTVLIRPNDARKVIFDDMLKTQEKMRFVLESVTGESDSFESRWAHGGGANRHVIAHEIVGTPHLSFENPVPGDGPRNGWLTLNLDGTPTRFDLRERDGGYTPHELSFDEVLVRLNDALSKNLKLRVTQRSLMPSLSVLVEDDATMVATLAHFRASGYTACVVRSFVPGSLDSRQVDVQLMSWPADIPDSASGAGQVFESPVLTETKKFAGLRDGEALALMEVIPGTVLNLVGNSDVEKSTKHKFARGIAKGLSDNQKYMYSMQSYGPAVSISAVTDTGEVAGLTRVCIRTDGAQYPNMVCIPSPHFLDAASVVFVPMTKEPAPV